MSRRVYLLGLGLALVALGLAFTDWVLSLRPGVTEANVRRIRVGMAMDEVEAIFGRIPDGVQGVWFGRLEKRQRTNRVRAAARSPPVSRARTVLHCVHQGPPPAAPPGPIGTCQQQAMPKAEHLFPAARPCEPPVQG